MKNNLNNKLVLANTEYSLLLYLLIDRDWKTADYILLTNNDKLVFKLKFYGCNVLIHTRLYLTSNYLFFSKLKFVISILFNLLKLYSNKHEYLIVYGNDDLTYARPFRKNNFHIIEDGTINYYSEEEIVNQKKVFLSKYIPKKILDKIRFKYIPFGYNKCISKVYLTNKDKVPSKIMDKVEVVNLKYLWSICKYKDEIMQIFNFDHELLEKLKDNRYSILFPFSEFERNEINERKIINRYKDAIKKSTSIVLIKPHRFDILDYSKYFDKDLIIDRNIPFELFILNDIRFDDIITFYDSSLLSHIEGSGDVVKY